ncbi:MAG: AAA family ATPase [Streptosporangiaceae bacterium]|nr:AAA family ATPase [Streptosporangiaceae bacterium]MBV9853222.1 AAA family ATPase [Streptosporangiaceae bacterium]
MVGRSGQLSALDAALGRTRRGEPSAVLVGGEAGVGKTRLVTEFAGRSRRTGARVLTGGCLELGTDGLPFAPFTAVLRELFRDLGADGVARLLPAGATGELARLLPEFGEPAGSQDTGAARARLFEQMLILFERLAEDDPVVLIIEDAHWADASTRDLLAFLIRNQRAIAGLLIVVTYRADELHRAHPLRTLLAELGRAGGVTRIELGRLGRRDTDELATRLMGGAPREDLLDAVYRRTEGNPLFVEMLAGDDLDSGLPESLRDLLVASVLRLPEESQDVVRVASAGGDRVGHALLAAVTGLDDRLLARALRPAVAANVLLTDSDGYAFRHALIREAVQGELLPGEDARLHGRFAEVIGENPALVPPGRAAVEQAHHWYAARDWTRALTGAWRGAAEAGRALAYAEQLAMLSRVLELWNQVPGAADLIGADHAAVLEAALRTAELAGEWDRGIAFADAALREVDAGAEPVRAGLLLAARGQLKHHGSRAGYAEDLRSAARLVPADPPSPARAHVLEALAHDHHHRPVSSRAAEYREYLALAEEAVAVARQTGDAVTEAAALITLACTLPLTGDTDQIRALLAEARAVAAGAGASQQLLKVDITESDLLEGLGQHESAAAVARAGIASAAEYGLARTSGAILAINLAEPLVSLGRWDEAAGVIEGSLRISPPRLSKTGLWRLSGDIALARGDLAAAAECAALIGSALEGTIFEDVNRLPLAWLETGLRVGQHRLAEALSTAEDALGHFTELPSPRYAWPLLVAGARACVAAGAARGGELTARAVALLGRLRAEAATLEVQGIGQRAQQLAFAAEAMRAGRCLAGDAPGGVPRSSEMRAAWEEAARAAETAGELYPLAMALLRSAEEALIAGDRDGAAAPLRRAAELAGRLGARPLGDEAALLARRARIPVGDDGGAQAGQQAAEPDRPGLTARELEVLRLVAAGRSNREIAAELFISAKTASVHVSNILAKLGVTSRGEAAAAAHRLNLVA